MNESWAIIIAAVITIGGSILAHYLTLRLNSIQSKQEHDFQFLRDKNERDYQFFLEVLPKRLSLYEDITLWLYKFVKEEDSHLEKPQKERFDYLWSKIEIELIGLESRCYLYGTDEVKGLLKELRNSFFAVFATFKGHKKFSVKGINTVLGEIIVPVSRKLLDRIALESPSGLIKDMIKERYGSVPDENGKKADENAKPRV